MTQTWMVVDINYHESPSESQSMAPHLPSSTFPSLHAEKHRPDMTIHSVWPQKQSADIMDNPTDYEYKQRCHLPEDGQTEDSQSPYGHASQVAYGCDSRRTLITQATPQVHVAASQPQAYSHDDKHNEEAQVRDLKGERCAPRLEMHREQDDNKDPSPVQLPEYHNDRNTAIIHFGVIGTHEGKTFVPKRSVHRNALKDLGHSYDEDQDFYVLNVNLDGDQVDQLLHYSEIYNAGGEYTVFLPKIAVCLLTHP